MRKGVVYTNMPFESREDSIKKMFAGLLREDTGYTEDELLKMFTSTIKEERDKSKKKEEEKEQLLNIARTNVVDAMVDYLEILGVIEDTTDEDKAELDKIFKESEKTLVKDIGDMKAIYGLGKAMGLF